MRNPNVIMVESSYNLYRAATGEVVRFRCVASGYPHQAAVASYGAKPGDVVEVARERWPQDFLGS